MRILLTNDDGINAPGLAALEHIAQELAGDGGEVWTIAPATEQSGVGHCISYAHPMLVTELAPRRFAINGTPADCVMAGVSELLPARPDLVLSGVNKGNNAGENVVYSGTIGAAMEGALQEIRSVALSQYYGPKNAKTADPFEVARVHGAALIRQLLDKGDWGQMAGYQLFYNVNFPPVPAAALRGTRVVPQGRREDAFYRALPAEAPNGRRYFWARGGGQHGPAAPGSDVGVLLDGYTSVTPLLADLTAHDRLAGMQQALDTPEPEAKA